MGTDDTGSGMPSSSRSEGEKYSCVVALLKRGEGGAAEIDIDGALLDGVSSKVNEGIGDLLDSLDNFFGVAFASSAIIIGIVACSVTWITGLRPFSRLTSARALA